MASIVNSQPIYVVEDSSGDIKTRKEESMTDFQPVSVARDHSQRSATVQKREMKLHIASESWSKPRTKSLRYKERYDQQNDSPDLPISSQLLTSLPVVVSSRGLKIGE